MGVVPSSLGQGCPVKLWTTRVSRQQGRSDVDIKGIGSACWSTGHEISTVGASHSGDNLLGSDVPCRLAQQVLPRIAEAVVFVLARTLATV